MPESMEVEVVCADQIVWSGQSSNIIARTVDGDMGILPGHSPVLAVLQPGPVVIFDDKSGHREIIAVDGGFISVAQGRVSVLSEYAQMAGDISLADAERELTEAQQVLDTGDYDYEDEKHFRRATAQLRAAQRAQ